MRASQEDDSKECHDADHRQGDEECDECEQGSYHSCAAGWFAA
ncbi:TPA: hypothetical protein ACPT6A_005339 [Escherichia coli]